MVVASGDPGEPLQPNAVSTTLPYPADIDGNRVMHIDQLMNRFIDDYTSVARRYKDAGQLVSITWVIHLPSLRGRSPTLDAAILALSTASLSRDQADPVMLRNSTIAYGKALAKLQRDLYSPKRWDQIETLVACLALILYQVMGEYPGKEDWMSHVKGISELVRLRGPKSYSSGIDHVVFRGCRISLVMAALCSVKSTFLELQPWLEQPWGSAAKNSYDSLIDLMARLPSMLPRCAEISNLESPDKRRDGRVALVYKCWSLEALFRDWYANLAEHTRRLKRVNSTSLVFGETNLHRAFPRSYEFTTLNAAHLHMMYWASLQVLYNLLKLLYQALEGIETSYYWPAHPAALRCPDCFTVFDPTFSGESPRCTCGYMESQPSFDASSLPPLTEEHDPVQKATQICMAVPFCFVQDLKLLGPYYALFPLKMAIGCFTGHLPATGRQLGWCYKVIDILESKGLCFSRSMLGMYEGRDLGGFAS